MHVLADLVAEAGGDLDQFDAASGAVVGAALRGRGPGLVVTDLVLVPNNASSCATVIGWVRCKQRRFDDVFQLLDLHGLLS